MAKHSIQIACDCGAFQATLTGLPNNSPGRVACYCKDCQRYLTKLGRTDRLDDFGGTELVPVYPSEMNILKGEEHLKCNKLSSKGLHRWSVTCCNSPIANTRRKFPWVGLIHSVFTSVDENTLNNLGDVKGRIFGRDAKPGAPFDIADKVGFKETLLVAPFILKGKLGKKHIPSPFYKNDYVTPIVKPTVLE